MTHQQLIAAAIAKYGFRAARPRESGADYLAALIKHVAQRDWSEAFELRLGRAQRDWSSEDAAAFLKHCRSIPMTRDEFSAQPGIRFIGVEIERDIPVTEASLREVADAVIEDEVQRRTDAPSLELAPAIYGLMTTGVLVGGPIPNSDDRIAILKSFAQRSPLFGYVIVFDAFAHQIVVEDGRTRAEKGDAIVMHVGTRELRLVRVRPYKVIDGVARFTTPPPADVDKSQHADCDDPYAGIFAVPLASARPS